MARVQFEAVPYRGPSHTYRLIIPHNGSNEGPTNRKWSPKLQAYEYPRNSLSECFAVLASLSRAPDRATIFCNPYGNADQSFEVVVVNQQGVADAG